MDKWLGDHRRVEQGFELIDFVEQGDIDGVRKQLDVDAPLEVQWNRWEYGSAISELRALYEKGKRNQWNATDDVDWSIPISKDEWIGEPRMSRMASLLAHLGADEATCKAAMFDEMAYVVSQLLHGEQAALQICGQLTNACPTTDEKYYAAQQAADEARHTEVLARFLSEKMGTIYPISPVNKLLLDKLLSAEGYYKKTLGMQTLFEGIAMAMLDAMSTYLTHPLFVDIMQRVKLDESRHAAFGVLTMRRAVREISEEQRAELEDWAFQVLEVLNGNQQLAMMRLLGPKYGIDAERWVRGMLRHQQWSDFNSYTYMHTVIPNLTRMGLITERTAPKYRALGMMSDIRLESS